MSPPQFWPFISTPFSGPHCGGPVVDRGEAITHKVGYGVDSRFGVTSVATC